jgi:mitochondrial fission protein ELM1
MDDSNKTPPRVWLLIGDKLGDNAQVEIIAEALGLPFEVRRVLPKPQFVLGKPGFRPSLDHLDLERSDELEPPWPDFILTIGRRPSMAALWIQEQSGGHSRIILLGRPKKWIERFALVIVPSQYQVPQRNNVLQLNLPLMRPNEAAIDGAAKHWRQRFDALERPISALFVGGQTKPFRFDAAAASELIQKTSRIMAQSGGTLYVSTSRRTPPEVVAALQDQLPANAILYRWKADDSANNPYLALLGLADRFIVTGDSISMMIEVARRGKPLAIFALPYQPGLAAQCRRILARANRADRAGNSARQWATRLVAALGRSGLGGYSRDLTAIHDFLYEQRLAVPLGSAFLPGGNTAGDELQGVVSRLRRLIDSA